MGITILRRVLAALAVAGVPEGHAETQIDLLLEAELYDRPSHGLLRLPRIIERIHNGVADPLTEGRAVWRSEAFLEVDGCRGLGPVVAQAALRIIAQRARRTGVAVAAIANNNHLGMLGWYVDRIAADGQIALALSTSEALVHPWGGRKAMLGTWPGLARDPAPGRVRTWMGHRPSTPDSRPVIGPASGCPDVFHAFGHGHIGLAAGALTGRLVADLVGGKPPVIDPAPYSARRFA